MHQNYAKIVLHCFTVTLNMLFTVPFENLCTYSQCQKVKECHFKQVALFSTVCSIVSVAPHSRLGVKYINKYTLLSTWT